MTQSASWGEQPFFEEPEPDSVDGGTTNLGPLWHAVTLRWGHSMHRMCSYHGMFPPKLVHYFLQRYSADGEVVLDPFSGRGTTTLQARVEGRRAIGNDLNPLASVLTAAKANPPTWSRMQMFVDRLESQFHKTRRSNPDVPPDIAMLFHVKTLRQIVFLRDRLILKSGWSAEDYMVAGSMAGILHGAHRSDGTSAYLSISMPNTFSMSPEYVRRFIAEKNLKAPEQDVFERLREKLARLYLDANVGPVSHVYRHDAVGIMSGRKVPPESVNLVITSPPYLKVVNYGTSNWIRLWWLGLDGVARQRGEGRQKLDAKLDHQHNYDDYKAFMLRVLRATARVLRPDGIAVYVIGDVATPDSDTISLAHQLWRDVGDRTGLRLIETIEDSLQAHNKVSRIWGETKGQATDRDCVLVLGKDEGMPRTPLSEIDWSEPYKDAGPDAAHARVRQTARATGSS